MTELILLTIAILALAGFGVYLARMLHHDGYGQRFYDHEPPRSHVPGFEPRDLSAF